MGTGGSDSSQDDQGPRSGVRRKVLVIDDSALILKLTSVMLNAGGFDVSTCDSAAGALLRVISEQPDLVLVDLDLGEVSGDRVIASIKNSPRTAHVRAYLYTASDGAEVAALVKRSRADGFVSKGSDGVALVQAVRRALAR